MKQGLTAPLRDDDESRNRGYDVFVVNNNVNFSELGGDISELRFAVRDMGKEAVQLDDEAGEATVLEDHSAKRKLGNLVTDSPGDPKVVTMWTGSMAVRMAHLVGSSGSYQQVHGSDPGELVLSSNALERREKIVDELVLLLTEAIDFAGVDEMWRLRCNYNENLIVDLSHIENKFGIGLGKKTFTSSASESLLNDEQEAFVRKRDLWLTQLERMVVDKLRPQLVEKGLLREEDGFAVVFHDDDRLLVAEINMPVRRESDEIED